MRMVLILILGCAFAHADDADAAVVLVTAFQPFAGRGVNGSETVARSLVEAEIVGAKVRILVLPVRWGEPERALSIAVTTHRPRLILGLGEGYPGRISVERRARNVAEIADEADVEPPETLRPDGPAERMAPLRFDPHWFKGASLPVVASDDAGAYLCNALFYTALEQAVPNVGFVHLPPQGHASADAYTKRCLPVIRVLIERNLAMP